MHRNAVRTSTAQQLADKLEADAFDDFFQNFEAFEQCEVHSLQVTPDSHHPMFGQPPP